MPVSYKPDGYPSVSVYIMANDARAVIDFVEKTFDAITTRRFDKEDGSVNHAEIKIDDTIVMIADGGNSSFPAWLHVYVPDVDVTYQRALEAGGESVQEPVQKDDPDRRSGVKDVAGNIWWISTQVG